MSDSLSNYEKTLSEIFRSEKFKQIINFPPSFGQLGLSGQRILLHFQGMAFAALGAPQKAKMTLEKALNYGENVQIYRDLACTHYQLDDIQSWRESYQRMQELLNNHAQDLSFDTNFTCYLSLSKFLEEEGRLGQALAIYKNLYSRPECRTGTRYYYLISPQLLRLKSLLPEDTELSQLYTQLLSCNLSQESLYIKTEIEHSLMLAELNLIGYEHAWKRVDKALKNKQVPSHDKRLFYVDFLEEVLLKQFDLSLDILNIGSELTSSFNIYEKTVAELIKFNGEEDDSNFTLTDVAREVPLGSFLRLLNLYSIRSSKQNIREEHQNKFALIISGFSSEDRSFWIKRNQSFQENKTTHLEINDEKRYLSFQTKRVDISRKKQTLNLLRLLADKPHWSIEDAIKNIWNNHYSPEHFNRLRMSVHRTNQLLQELTAKDRCINIDSETLNLSPNVKILRRL